VTDIDKHASLLWYATNYNCRKFYNSGTGFTTIYFIVTYEWAHRVRVLHYTRLERLARDKHSSYLGLFVSCIANEVL
jgi:hypothetical protein